MTVATFTQTNSTTQLGGTYLANLDGDISVHQTIAGMFAPHQAATPNMTVVIDPGSVLNGSAPSANAQQTSNTITAPASGYTRIDRVVVGAVSGIVQTLTGTPSTGTPSAPAIANGYYPCCQILLTASTTAITNSIITDERTFIGGAAQYATTAGSATTAATAATAGALTTPYFNTRTSWSSPNRILGSVYPNTGTTPMYVCVNLGNTSGSSSFAEGNVNTQPFSGMTIPTSASGFVSMMVPPGESYQVTYIGGALTVNSWIEIQ